MSAPSASKRGSTGHIFSISSDITSTLKNLDAVDFVSVTGVVHTRRGDTRLCAN